MSVRSVSTCALAAALLLGAVRPAAAQEPGSQVPISGALLLQQTKGPPAVAVPVEAAPGVRFTVPQLGPLALDFDFPLPQTSASDHRQVFNFGIGLFGGEAAPTRPPMSRDMTGGIGSYCAPVFPRLAPPHLVVNGPSSIRLVAAQDVFAAPTCPPCPLPKVVPNPLLGTWHRTIPGLGLSVVATFTHDELKLNVTQNVDGTTATLSATAHYAITADGLVYGAVTGADVDIKDTASNSPEERIELALTAQALVDAPFSFRTKATSAGLMVSGVKCGMPMGRNESEQLQLAFGGLFKFAQDGKVPAPAAPATKTSKAPEGRPVVGAAVRVMPAPVPPGCVIERVGIDFNTNPPVMCPPAPPTLCPPAPSAEQFGPPFLSTIPYLNRLFKNVGVAAPPEPLPPPRQTSPGVSEDGTKQLAQDAFGQLLQQSGVVRPAPGFDGMTLPSGRYLDHYPQYFPPDPQHPLPRELAGEGAVRPVAATVPAVAVKGAVGTWFREVAGKQCVVKVTADHLTLTVHDAQEVDGKVSTASLVITADYHLTRDGITAVGLITSVDVSFEGDFPAEDSKPFFDMLADLQKVLEDKPFALTFRTYGEALVIGNVRMPQVSDRMEVQPAGYLGGRYKAAGDKLPKPKPVKMPPPGAGLRFDGPVPNPPALPTGPPLGAPGVTLPPSYATPGYAPPPLPSSAPGSDLLPPQQLPQTPRTVVPSGGADPWAPAPTMPEPRKPVPQMPPPIPPATDHDRIQGLLYQSDTRGPIGETLRTKPSPEELLRQLEVEWRRFWFNDQPSHLTPERIHGGIY